MSEVWVKSVICLALVSSYSMGEASGAFQCGMVSDLRQACVDLFHRPFYHCCASDAIRLATIQGQCHDFADQSGTMMVVIGIPTQELEQAIEPIGLEIGAYIAADLVYATRTVCLWFRSLQSHSAIVSFFFSFCFFKKNCLTGTQSQIDEAHTLLSTKNAQYKSLTLIKNGVRLPFHSRHFYPFEHSIRAQYRELLASIKEPRSRPLKWSSSIVGHEATLDQCRSDAFWFDVRRYVLFSLGGSLRGFFASFCR